MTTESDLINLIQSLIAPWLARKAATGGDYAGPSQWDISLPLRMAMDSHPEFSESRSTFFLSKQIAFFNHHQSINILNVASQIGAAEALLWYRRVRSTRRTRMRLVGELHGILPQKAATLSNGVSIVPLAELPASPQTESLKASARLGPATYMPAGVVFEIGEVEATDNDEDGNGHRQLLEYIQLTKQTITAFTLHDRAAPTLGSVWLQFNDENLHAADYGLSWMTSRPDGRHQDHPIGLEPVMIEWAERYIALPPSAKAVVDFPLSRLNLARRRVTARDKAVDVCVAMESLLGTSFDERTSIASEVRKLYALRSELVHGGDSLSFRDDPKELATSQRGLELCLAAIRRIVESGEKPEPDHWELTGGPPFNRYNESETSS